MGRLQPVLDHVADGELHQPVARRDLLDAVSERRLHLIAPQRGQEAHRRQQRFRGERVHRPQARSQEIEELRLTVWCEAVGRSGRRIALHPGYLLEEAIARQAAQRVVHRPRIEMGPLIHPPRRKLAPHEIAMHGRKDPHCPKDQQTSRHRHQYEQDLDA